MDIYYDGGLDLLDRNYASNDFTWLLLQPTHVPDSTDGFIADLTDEVSVASYARVAATGISRVVDTAAHEIQYFADNVAFGDLEDTQFARYLVLAQDVTNDADSPLVGAFDIGEVRLGNQFVVYLNQTAGFAAARQGA